MAALLGQLVEESQYKRLGREDFRKAEQLTFPYRLYLLLESGVTDNATWHPTGKALVLNRTNFNQNLSAVCGGMFGTTKWHNVLRQLQLHGFRVSSNEDMVQNFKLIDLVYLIIENL